MVYFLCKVYDSDRQNCYFAQSLPVRGAWIEMHDQALFPAEQESLPVRGAWIEMGVLGDMNRYTQSLPVRGAWIEIVFRMIVLQSSISRSPCGERGLKCPHIFY